MKIVYYCQHVLGVGHFHRSLEICRAFSQEHRVTMIIGGPDIDTGVADIEFFQLPGLMMNEEFQGLQPCAPNRDLEEVKQQRATLLLDYFTHHTPDIFLIELYPFGRKAFRFELDPVLHYLSQGATRTCSCFCSLRDILVEKVTGAEKFATRACTTLNSYFDGLLIHADSELVRLEKTFSHTDQITVPIHYTGFVTPHPAAGSRERIRAQLQIDHDTPLVVASIGGGNVGAELLLATARAFRDIPRDQRALLQIFTGPYCDSEVRRQLNKLASETMYVSTFSKQFPDWLAAADLSISMGGYNSCMNILAAGIPALILPFAQNQEQRLRLDLLTSSHIQQLGPGDLSADRLRAKIIDMLHCPRFTTAINLKGARETVATVLKWHHNSCGNSS